jgi:hypothetical protein
MSPTKTMTEGQRQQAETIIRGFLVEKKAKVAWFPNFPNGHVLWDEDQKTWLIQAEIRCNFDHLKELDDRLRAAGLL